MNTIRANIYGDSIMKGTVVSDDLTKHTVMEETLDSIYESYKIETTNKSRFGITINMGKSILDRDLKKGLDCEYAVIEFGGNDCNYRWDEVAKDPDGEHHPLTPIGTFKETYKNIIDTLKKANIKPIGVSLPPLDAEKYFEFLKNRGNDAKNLLKWMGDRSTLYRFHESYSDAAAKIAKAAGILFVDIRGYFLDKRNFKELMCIDGIHPNENGHKLIHKAFDDFVAANLQPIATNG